MVNENRVKKCKAYWTEEKKKEHSERMKKYWQDEKNKERLSKQMKKYWSDPLFRKAFDEKKKKIKTKEKQNIDEIKNKMIILINGRAYYKSTKYFSTKQDALHEKKIYKSLGVGSILDKRKKGYFLWLRLEVFDK